MNVTNSIVDFFQGNPFNNPVGSLIEKATDFKNKSENWTLFMEVCDVMNSMEDGPRLAIRAIKRRLTTEMNKDTSVILYTLTLLETCIKNCGYRFQIVVCSRDFLQEFEKIVLNNAINQQGRPEVPTVVRDRMLYLIQSWYDSFKGQPDFKEIEILYMYMLECGIQFPMTDLNTMSPINTPKRTVPPPQVLTVKPMEGDTIVDVALPESPVVIPQQSAVSSESIIDKLSKDLQTVQANLDVMCELMREYSPTEHIPDNAICLMKNLYEANSEMQKRLLQLINRWEETQLKDSSILFDMLRVNDEMNSALAQYGRYERAIAGGINKSEEVIDINSRISKSNVSDVFAAQQESEQFYDGISKGSKSAKLDKRNVAQLPEENQNLISTNNSIDSRPALGALSSQEFDQFLSEQAQSSLSINGDNHTVPQTDRQRPFGTKSKNENSQLFDL